jgi:hypothetical protein
VNGLDADADADAEAEAKAEVNADLDAAGAAVSKSVVAAPVAGKLGFVMRRPRRSKVGDGGSSSAARLARRLKRGRVLLTETRARAAEGSCRGEKK